MKPAPLLQLNDVTLLVPPAHSRLVVAVDSAGGIGPKELDQVRVDGYVVGRFTCRVPLMEVMAVGAIPVVVVAALCVEPEPTGRRILAGIRDEVATGGLQGTAVVTGSSEKNVTVFQTGVGITVIGLVSPNATDGGDARTGGRAGAGDGAVPGGNSGLRWGRSRRGELVVCVGRPKVGSEVRLEDDELADLPTLKRVLEFPGVSDVLPVGSGGILQEAGKLAARSGARFAASPTDLDLARSGGPATCLLVALAPAHWPDFRRHIAPTGRPVQPVGEIA